MAWSSRPREEGPGNIIVRRARAWQFAKNRWVPDSKVDRLQPGSTNAEKTTYRRTNRVKEDLVCEWWFDEGEGTLIQDKTVGTDDTSLQWIQALGGDWAQDASLDNRYFLNLSDASGGARNSGSIEPIERLRETNEVTFETWFKPQSANGLATTGPGRVAILAPINTNYSDQCLMFGHGSWTGNSAFGADAFSARIKVEDSVVTLVGDGLATTGLHHLVLAANLDGVGNARLRFYVDGELVDSKALPVQTSNIFEDWDISSRLAFGADRDGQKHAPGGYYLAALYNRSLTPAEITKNYSDGVVAYSGGYKKEIRGIIEDAETELKAGESDKFFVSVSGGTHLETLTFTLAASSDDATMVYGEDFTLDPSVVKLGKGVFQSLVGLSCHADTSAYHVVHVYIDSMTGGATPIQPLNDAYDSFDVSVTAKAIPPELKFSYNANPDYIPAPIVPVVDAFTVAKTRDYDQEISFTVTATADPANTADYYFASGSVPGVFSAPFQPNPGVNCGTNNQIWQQTHGSPVTLSAWGGDSGNTDKITTDGLVVENAILNGIFKIRANNVTLRNCLIQGGVEGSDPLSWSLYALDAWGDGFSGLLVEDCEITRADSSVALFNRAVVRRCYFHTTRFDLVKTKTEFVTGDAGYTTIESSYFGEMGNLSTDPLAHADAWQHAGPGTDLICRWNYFDIPGYYATPPNRIHSAAIIWQNKAPADSVPPGGYGPLKNLVIDSNWFNGGSNAVLISAVRGDTNEAYVINNKFRGEVADYDTYVNDDWTGMEWCAKMFLPIDQKGPFFSDLEYFSFNNRLYDGSLAYWNGNGPNSSSAYLIDNLTAPPSIPFYDSGTVNKVDLSTGITLRIGADELSKPVLIYSEATNSDGIFVDGDSVSGFLVSGDVRSGDDLGTTLQVCSTLSAHEIIFEDSGFARTGLGDGLSVPTRTGSVSVTYEDENDLGRVVQERGKSPVFSYEEMSLDEYSQMIEMPPVGGETSATTGPRIATSDHPHKDLCWFVDPGQANASNKIEVPSAGLIVSGYAFKEVRIKTTNPLRFVDCEFSGQTDFHVNHPGQRYVVWDNNEGGEGVNRKVDFEYCDFKGGSKNNLMMNFRILYKCRWPRQLEDSIKFRSGNSRVSNCWFGPLMNMKDNAALNGNSGDYNENQGLDIHADVGQVYKTQSDIIHYAGCTFAQRPATWSDGTTNPDHVLGAQPDKIFQLADKQMDGVFTRLTQLLFTDCILNGGGNYMFCANPTVDNNPGGSELLPCNYRFKNCKFGTSTRSGIFECVSEGHTFTDLGGNVWLETGTPGIRLPQEALDAGTTTALGRNNLPISYVIRGLDRVNFNADGMNEGGKTSWGQRGIGWG